MISAKGKNRFMEISFENTFFAGSIVILLHQHSQQQRDVQPDDRRGENAGTGGHFHIFLTMRDYDIYWYDII
jgi:hypothetical protein